MNKQELLVRRDYFNLVHGVTVRAVDAFSDADLDFRPKAGMRSPRDLVFHIYTQERTLAEAAQQGQFTLEMANRSNPEEPSVATTLSTLRTVSDLLAYVHACHQTS